MLASLPAQLAFAERMEEANAWRNPVDLVALLEAAFEELPEALAAPRSEWGGRHELVEVVLTAEPAEILEALLAALARRARRWSSSPRPSRSRRPRGSRASRSRNEFGDWDTALHTFTFANAVEQGLRRSPSAGARARDPRRGDERPPRPLPERPRDPAAAARGGRRPGGAARRAAGPARRASSRWTRPAQLVASYLGAGGDPDRLVAALGACLLREDRNFHTTQCVEAAARQHELLRGTDDASLPLIAAARYLAAHAPTARSQRQTFEIAQRLHRGERIYEDEDLPPAA